MLLMNRSLRHRTSSLLAAILLSAGVASADIIILKSGDRIDGKIIAEDPTSFTVEYQLTPKIKDKKIVNKSDIKELTRFTPAQVEMEEKGLKKIVPTADLLKASDYESTIQDRLRTFVAKHPGTPEAKEVEGMIAILSEEKTKVLSGQIKMEGKWLDEATAKREAYNIEAYRLRSAMKAKAAEVGDPNNLLEALREFDTLKTNYPASLHYLQAIPEALDILEKYDKRLLAMAAEQPVILANRDAGIKSLQGSDLERAKAAIDLEEREFKAKYDVQVKNKAKWRDVHKYNSKSIQDAMLVVAKERTDLRSISLPALQTEIENLNSAIRFMAEENPDEAEASMARLRPDKARLVNKKVFDTLDKELSKLKVKKAAEMKAAKANMVAGGDGTAVEDGADGSNPIADAMKKKELAKKKAAAEKEAKEKEQTAARLAAAAKAAAEPPPEPTMLEKINAYIPYIGGGLLLVLIIAMVLGKKKKDDDE